MASKSISPHSSQSAKLSYSDTIRAFNDETFISNLNDACRNLAKSSAKLLQAFDTISNELSSVDIQVHKTTPPTRPLWTTIQRDFKDVIRQNRVSAGLISGRLKMFYGLILPMVARDIDGRSPRSHNEKIHVLKSYMNISSDHAAFTHNLATTALKVTSNLNHFHTEFAKMSSGQGKKNGQTELRDLTHKLSHLENVVNQLCFTLGQSSLPDVAVLVLTVLKVSATRRSPRQALTLEKMVLGGSEAAAIGALYERLEDAHNELVHAQYSVQVAHRNTDIVATTRTAISSLVSEEMLNIQTGLCLFLTIWATLRTECMDILYWLENQKKHPKPPPCVEAYLTDGRTLYFSLAGALDAYVEGLEPSHLAE
ncbi:hypothetical protein L218DRAFT_1002458 [Marasmius fiardii PR-910]|nr:hypothetical protein L218DRAFT_1002458 [Marasmius fiardii PR-910]